jgi:hypothetical protein
MYIYIYMYIYVEGKIGKWRKVNKREEGSG